MRKLQWLNFERENEWFLLLFQDVAALIEGKREGKHQHDFCELFIVACAGITHCVNDQQIPLPKNTLVLIRPGDTHCFKVSRQVPVDKAVLMNMAFPALVVNDLRVRLFGGSPAFWGGQSPLPAMFQLSVEAKDRLWSDGLMRSRRDRLALEHFLLSMLYLINPGIQEDKNEMSAPVWLQQACHRMQEPQNMRGGLDRFYVLCGKCREHISRQLKLHHGDTPVDFILKLRIRYAARLLADTSLPLDDIAAAVGFENLSYFFTAFKKYRGVTPRKYRATINKIM